MVEEVQAADSKALEQAYIEEAHVSASPVGPQSADAPSTTADAAYERNH